MSVLLMVGEQDRRAVERIVGYAREHVYRPGGPVPGDNPEHVHVFLPGIRAVFSFTEINGKRFRHLSLSGAGLPYPVAVPVAHEIAKLFGLDPARDDCAYGLEEEGGRDIVVYGQPA